MRRLDTFHRLLPMAAPNNLRLVILNRRDYAGSTKYTEAELESLREGRREFLENLGLETITFLAWFATTQDIPKLSADRKTGGFVTIGWSMGGATYVPDLPPFEYTSQTKTGPSLC